MNEIQNIPWNKAPKVSVIMPCYNEEMHLYDSINSLLDIYFKENCELIVVDGKSTDWTRVIVQHFINYGLNIRVIENEKRIQAHGLNLGIANSKGEIIVRADAHCIYPPGYVEICVNLLEKTGAANAGGIMFPQGKNTVQKAIALALQHPAGVGNAKWHTGNYKGYVDTVYLGTFRKSLFDEIGLFDTKCQTNQDGELNLRILKTGKKIYLDSSIKVKYYPRNTLRDLARQYFRYGRGRCYTTLKHKKITSFRQVLPVLLILCLLASIGLSLWNPIALMFPSLYIISLLLTALFTWPQKKNPIIQRLFMGTAWAIMHISWGSGFVSRLLFQRT